MEAEIYSKTIKAPIKLLEKELSNIESAHFLLIKDSL